MELTAPCYYQKFQCLAGACRHSCCREGWQIVVDEKTMDFYRSLPAPRREAILGCIAQDGEGDWVIQSREGVCPFLTAEGLCQLVISYGDQGLGEICALHPRYREWFPGRMEIGVGLCCEEAARLILSDPAPCEFETWITDSEEEDEEPAPLYPLLVEVREVLFALLQEREQPLRLRLARCLRLALSLQEAVNRGEDPEELAFSRLPGEQRSWQQVLAATLRVHQEMEHLNPEWTAVLEDLDSHQEELDWTGFERALGQRSYEYEHLAVYLIFRYFLKAVYDKKPLEKVWQTVVMVLMMATLAARRWGEKNDLTLLDQIEVVRLYSSETEYSDENMQLLAEALLFEPELSAAGLLGLLEGSD